MLSINGIKDEDAVEPNIIERRVFCNYSDAEREEIAGKISVIERSSTNDQLFLVQGLKKRGHVVAATGDGTNDAPVYTRKKNSGRYCSFNPYPADILAASSPAFLHRA